jgi:hypothetical protein
VGCFSFLCKESGKAALSTSSDGSPCRLFLLEGGHVIEEMHGNYDSYGRVFTNKLRTDVHHELRESFQWTMDWSDVCDLMQSSSPTNGIAMVLDEYWTGEVPTTRSEDDPDQGWGEEDEFLMGDCSTDKFPTVEEPYHRRTLPVLRENWLKRTVDAFWRGGLIYRSESYRWTAEHIKERFSLTEDELMLIYRDYKDDFDSDND